jgi:formate hydrogenlyase subunit 3/multisubunit Na+/H+ antiporter MnhD subunit
MAVNLLIMVIAVPLIIAIINVILPAIIRKILTLAALGYTLVLTYFLYMEPPSAVIIFGETAFAIDRMSIFAIVFIQVLSFIILVFSLKGITKEIEKSFFVLYPMTVAFCNGVVVSENMISMLIFWGLSGMTLYFFALLGRTKDAPQTAKKTFIIIGGSDAFLILGFALMWFLQPAAGWTMSSYSVPLSNSIAISAFILLLIAAFAKAGGFPFHTWVPDFSKDAPVESAAFLPASLDKLLGIYLLARMIISYFTVELVVNLIIVSLGALTVITAVMMAINQHNGRKLLGYHAVSQVGYMIMGIGSGSVLAFAGGLFHLINHTIYKSNLFLSLGSVEKKTGTNELDELGGLGKVMPITFIMALIGALSISGIPPFNGFFSKWMIYQGLLEKASNIAAGYQIWMLLCIILAIFGSALTLASFMKFIHAVFLGRRSEALKDVKEAPANQWIATGLLSVLCIGFGIFAVEVPLRKFISPLLAEYGWTLDGFIGTYNPQMIVVLFLIAFIIGIGVYLLTKKVRYDDVYLGGMSPADKFRVLGTEFYNEIRNMIPLKSIYNAAENKRFDMYDISGSSTFVFSRIFQKAHPGQLQLYLFYIVIGLLIFIWMVN